MTYQNIQMLVQYGINHNLVKEEDRLFIQNCLLEIMELSEVVEQNTCLTIKPLHDILEDLVNDACQRSVILDTQGNRDLFDTKLMGVLTPRPSAVIAMFQAAKVSKDASEVFYQFNQDTNYIRTDRIKKDIRWQTLTTYGTLDITINMSKPEKDPRDIAAAINRPKDDYPACMLCVETEGYAGRVDFPARQNHRIIPLSLCDERWGFQYSPYVYYHQHNNDIVLLFQR